MKVEKKTWLFYSLLLFTILEVLSATYFQKYEQHVTEAKDITSLWQMLGSNLSSIGYLLAGLAIAIIPMLHVTNPIHEALPKKNTAVKWVLITASLVFVTIYLREASLLFSTKPIDYHYADMLPVIKIMNERWVTHDDVYALIPQFWDGEKPVYLPAMWMPFAPSALLHFDMRYITFGAVLLGLLFTVLSVRSSRWSWHTVVAITPFLLLIHFLVTSSDYFRWTEEGLVVGFYLFLAFSIMWRNIWLLGISISLCLLSRFSFAGWVPLFFLVNYLHVSKKQTLQIAFISFGCSLVLLIWSQAIGHLPFLLNLSEHYLAWMKNPDNGWSYEGTILLGLGVAKWVAFSKLIWLQRALIAITIIFPIVGYCVYRWGKNINREFFLLAMLKLYLVIFYNLLVLPYTYLFFTSTFLSCFIVYRYSREVESVKMKQTVA